jgi:hypothetical protein
LAKQLLMFFLNERDNQMSTMSLPIIWFSCTHEKLKYRQLTILHQSIIILVMIKTNNI